MMSIDFLRGITIFTMILVNNPGSWSYQYSPLKHAAWHGWTITDLVFPFFLFIVGLSISISTKKSRFLAIDDFEKTSKVAITSDDITQILVRSAKLFSLGLLLALSYYNFYDPDFSWLESRLTGIRWFGVLQRIALVYFFCALIHHAFSNRVKVILSFALLIGYWFAMTMISYQDSQAVSYQGLLVAGNNLAAFLDHHLIGISHLYHKSSTPFSSDPEGLLTTIPALVNCLIGILVGDLILSKPSLSEQIRLLFFWGAVLVASAYLISMWVPFNKNLWTPSYVLLSSGFAMILLGASRWLIDEKDIKLWSAPFIVFGTNAIALFMISGLVARLLSMVKIEGLSLKTHLYQLVQYLSNQQELNSLVFAVLFVFIMYIPLNWMYTNKIFWKV